MHEARGVQRNDRPLWRDEVHAFGYVGEYADHVESRGIEQGFVCRVERKQQLVVLSAEQGERIHVLHLLVGHESRLGIDRKRRSADARAAPARTAEVMHF